MHLTTSSGCCKKSRCTAWPVLIANAKKSKAMIHEQLHIYSGQNNLDDARCEVETEKISQWPGIHFLQRKTYSRLKGELGA